MKHCSSFCYLQITTNEGWIAVKVSRTPWLQGTHVKPLPPARPYGGAHNTEICGTAKITLIGDWDVQTWLLRTLLHQVLRRQVLLEALHRKRSRRAPAEEKLQVFGNAFLCFLEITFIRNRPLPWQMIFHALISKPDGASQPQILYYIHTNYDTQQAIVFFFDLVV